MRKIIRLGLVCILLFSTLVACGGVTSPEAHIWVGEEVSIFKKDTVKVTGATKEEGKIVVSMDINFNTIALEEMQIWLEGYDVDTSYDKEETVACNEEVAFLKGYVGQVLIVFTDDAITSEQELSEYTIQMEYHKGETRVLTDELMLEDDRINQ